MDEARRAQLRQRYRAFLDVYGLGQEPTPKQAHAIARSMAGDFARARWGDLDPSDLRPDGQAILEGFQDEILAAASELGHHSEWDLLTGEFPTGAVNAEVHPLPDASALVLISRGLMQAIWEISKLLVRSLPVETSGAQTQFDFNGPQWADEEARDADVVGLAAIFAGYLMLEDTTRAPHLHVPDPARSMVASGITSECERFVIAHEIAHAIGGDLVRETHARPTPAGKIVVLTRTWQEELTADRLGTSLLLTSAGVRSQRPDVDPGLTLASAPAGAILLFWLQSAIEPIADMVLDQLTGDKPVDLGLADHPPPRLRKEFTWRTLRELGVDDQWLVVARYVDAWFKAIAPEVPGAVRAGARSMILGSAARSRVERQERALERARHASLAGHRALEQVRQDAYWSAVADQLEGRGDPSSDPGTGSRGR